MDRRERTHVVTVVTVWEGTVVIRGVRECQMRAKCVDVLKIARSGLFDGLAPKRRCKRCFKLQVMGTSLRAAAPHRHPTHPPHTLHTPDNLQNAEH